MLVTLIGGGIAASSCTNGNTAPTIEPQTGAAEEGTPTPRPTVAELPFETELAIMDGYEPELLDGTGDVREDGAATHDLVSAYAVASDQSLMLRIASAEPMTKESLTDVRLWIEQGERQLTLEAKPDHPGNICELTPIGKVDGEEVPDCVRLGDNLDIRIPLGRLPGWLDPTKEFHISGVSTCCADEAREVPYDEIDGAQQVWILPGAVSAPQPAGAASE